VKNNSTIDAKEDDDDEGAEPISIPFLEKKSYDFSKLTTSMYKEDSNKWKKVTPDHLPSVGPITDEYVNHRMRYVCL
jgi:hypothetical protein